MIAARWASGMLAVLCFVIVLVRMSADGVLVLGTVFFVAWLATFGVFTWAFWFPTEEVSEQLSASDQELDLIASVQADLAALDQQGNARP